MTSPDSSQWIPRASLSDAVYERLHDEIIHGRIPDGSKISQGEIAARYGVSRIPVREALRRLQAESLVVATPYRPYVVRNVSSQQVLELVDIRASLEDLALTRREPLTPDVIVQLREMNQKMAEECDGTSFLAADRDFHHLIAGPGTVTVEILDDVRRRLHNHLNVMMNGKLGRTTATQEHEKIIDALAAHDIGLTRQLMQEHVRNLRAFVARNLEVDESGLQHQY